MTPRDDARPDKPWALWILVTLVVGIILAASAAFTILRASSDRYLLAQTNLVQLRAAANRLDALEWESIALGSFDAELFRQVTTAQQQVHEANAQTDAGVGRLGIGYLDNSIGTYLQAITLEYAYQGQGDFAWAEITDQQQVKPAYQRLDRDIERARLTLNVRARQANRTASLGGFLAIALASALIVTLLLRYERGRRRAVLVEQTRILGSEARFHSLAHNSSDVITVLDEDGRIQYQSASREHLLGWRDDELLGTDFMDLVHPEDRDHVAIFIAGARGENQRPSPSSWRMRARTGAWIPCETLIADWSRDPAVAGLVLNTRDVSERQKVEQAKDAFMTAVSHELRTPLTSIIGYAQTLQRRHASIPPEEQERLLERVVANGQKLSKMIADLLDSDRLKRGILQALRRETDVAALVRETVAGFETRRPVEVIASRANACVDPAMVARIVENLVANADRHTPKGERVLVTVQRAQDGVYIAVEDHGPGIPEEFRAAIFEPFRQGPVVPENSPGIGIGLSLVAQFAALHDGKAWVEPSENGGACFRVFLADPADIPADDGAAPLPSAA